MSRPAETRTPPGSGHRRSTVLAAVAAAVCVLLTGDLGAVAEDAPAAPGANWSISSEPSRNNWRSRELLQVQRRATGAVTGTTGTEAGKVLDNYYKSIGKGGAGADLPPRNQSTSGSSQ